MKSLPRSENHPPERRTTLEPGRRVVLALTLLLGAACATSQADRVQQAEQERADRLAQAQAGSEAPPSEPAPSAADKPLTEDVRERAEERLEQAQTIFEEERRAFELEAKNKLDAIDADIDEVKRKAQARVGQVDERIDEELRELEAEKERVKRQIDELPRVADEAWDDARRELRDDLERLDDEAERLLDQV